ncbi:MAG: hypothetical protein ABI351_01650 [Herbaspirillum sp.]
MTYRLPGVVKQIRTGCATAKLLLFVMVGTRILVIHAISHRVIEQDGDLTSCGCHRLGIADAPGKASVKALSAVLLRPTVTVANRIATVSLLLVLRVCADGTLPPLILQPGANVNHGGTVFSTTPSAEVCAAFANEAQGQEWADSVDLRGMLFYCLLEQTMVTTLVTFRDVVAPRNLVKVRAKKLSG